MHVPYLSLKRASRMSMQAAASRLPCTVMRTISAPASTHFLTCSTVAATSRVSAEAIAVSGWLSHAAQVVLGTAAVHATAPLGVHALLDLLHLRSHIPSVCRSSRSLRRLNVWYEYTSGTSSASPPGTAFNSLHVLSLNPLCATRLHCSRT